MLPLLETQSNFPEVVLLVWLFFFVCLPFFLVLFLYFVFVLGFWHLGFFSSFFFRGGMGVYVLFLCYSNMSTIFAIWKPLSLTPWSIYFFSFGSQSTRLFNPLNPCSAVRMTAVKSATFPLPKWSGKPIKWIGHLSLWPKGTIHQFLYYSYLICFSFFWSLFPEHS